MDYTITPQYHEKKGCYIYVVRLSDRVEKDDFSTLSDLAKAHKGYYSSFRGVNGFVFKTEEQAEEFCEDMIAILDTIQTVRLSSTSKDSSKEKPQSPLVPPSSGMELHKALRSVIQTEGKSIITEVRLVNILDDFKAYSDMPTAKYILRAIIADGFAQKLLYIGKWNNDAINLAYRFTSTTGFLPDVVEVLFLSLAFGLNWINDEDFITIYQKSRNDSKRFPYNASEKSVVHLPLRRKVDKADCSGNDSHLKFMGIPICGKVNKFEKVLLKKGFHGFGNDNYKFMGPFVGLENCWCTFTESSFSKEIWKVAVNTDSVLTDAVKSKNNMYNHFIRIRDLYTKKYGVPVSSDNYEIGIGVDWETIASSDFCAEEISTFYLPTGTITIKLSSWGIDITYVDKKSYELHNRLANQCSSDDI